MIKLQLPFKIIATLLLLTLIYAQQPLTQGNDASNFARDYVSIPSSDCYQNTSCITNAGSTTYTVAFPGAFTSNGDIPMIITGIYSINFVGEPNASIALSFSAQITTITATDFQYSKKIQGAYYLASYVYYYLLVSTTYYNKNYIYSAHFTSPYLGDSSLGPSANPTTFILNTTVPATLNASGGTKSYVSITGMIMAWNSQQNSQLLDIQAEFISYDSTTASFKVYSFNVNPYPNTLWYVMINWVIYNINYYTSSRITIDIYSFDKVITSGGYSASPSIKLQTSQYITMLSQMYYTNTLRIPVTITLSGGTSGGTAIFKYENMNMQSCTVTFIYLQFNVGVCPSSDPYFSDTDKLCYATCPDRTYG